MKKKLHKILGVALTVTLLASLMVGLAAAPAAAGPNKWFKLSIPMHGADGDYFIDNTIDAGPGPWAQAIDGTLYCYASRGTAEQLFKSTDEGRSWSRQVKYTGDAIVDIFCSPLDADIVYVLDVNNTIWKTANGGGKFTEIAALHDDHPNTGNITSIAVGYIGDDPYLFAATMANVVNGGVWVLQEAVFGGGWQDTDLAADHGSTAVGTDVDVFEVVTSLDFEGDQFLLAIILDNTAGETYGITKYGGATWGQQAEFGFDPTPATNNLDATTGATVWLPEDFDSDFDSGMMEYFVGIQSGDADEGDVYRAVTDSIFDTDIGGPNTAKDVTGLDGVGDAGDAMLLAGITTGHVYRTTNNAGKWDNSLKKPVGVNARPIVAEDFASSDEAWVAAAYAAGPVGAVSRTTDGGNAWNGISLIAGDMATITDFEPTPDYGSSGALFMITSVAATTDPPIDLNGGIGFTEGDSLWKYDGENWERVYHMSLLSGGDDSIDDVEVSPEWASDSSVFILDRSVERHYRSTSGGSGTFSRALNNITTDPVYNWLIIDKGTILVSSISGGIWRTTNNGTTWAKKVAGGNDIFGLALDPNNPDNILAGNDNGGVYLSTNGGNVWKLQPTGAAVPGGTWVFPAFDPEYADNSLIYAAALGGQVYRLKVGVSSGWAGPGQISGVDGTFPDVIYGNESLGVAGGTMAAYYNMVIGPDGILYVVNTDGDPVARCQNPRASDTPAFNAAYFETIPDAYPPGDAFGLWMTQGSNTLWTIRYNGTSWAEIRTYTDAIEAPSLVSPTDGSTSGRTGEVAVSFEAVTNADKYHIWWAPDPGFPSVSATSGQATVTTTGFRITGLEPGRTYYWRVCVAEGEKALSAWSATWSFTTGLSAAEWNPFVGGIPEAPYNGATNVPIRPSFAWNAADWATGYEFVLATDAAFTDAVTSKTGANALTNTVFLAEGDLAYSTTYYWKVRAVSKTSDSEWAQAVFTTEAEAPEPPEPPPPPPPTPEPTTPVYIWVIIGIGAALVIAVIILIVRTRRVP
jgi:photosystem II stability/assembly factor-like uncharacterized protein